MSWNVTEHQCMIIISPRLHIRVCDRERERGKRERVCMCVIEDTK